MRPAVPPLRHGRLPREQPVRLQGQSAVQRAAAGGRLSPGGRLDAARRPDHRRRARRRRGRRRAGADRRRRAGHVRGQHGLRRAEPADPGRHAAQRDDEPDVIRPGYDEAGLLSQVDVWLQQAAAPAALLDPATADRHAVTGIDYNARGQRVSISFGNGTGTAYAYDPQTFRLTQLTTTRPALVRGRPADRPGPGLLLRPGRQHHPHPRRRRHPERHLLQQPAGRAVGRLHLRPAVPADRRHRPRAPRPDRRRAVAAAAGHQRRFVPHRPAAARRRQRDGHLHRDLRLRRGRQPPDDGPPGRLGQLDAALHLRRAVADRRRPRPATGCPPPACPAIRRPARSAATTPTTRTAT